MGKAHSEDAGKRLEEVARKLREEQQNGELVCKSQRQKRRKGTGNWRYRTLRG